MNNNVISQMISKFDIKNIDDEINALKEIIQEIILCGLSRGGFFNVASFYGGTALRIFYKLDRFSEDLDFALNKPDKNFDLSKYFKYIDNELKSYGLNLDIDLKSKSIESNITSAYVKGDTLEHILKFFPNNENFAYNNILKKIKIKFEVDINPPSGAISEYKYKLLPSPHQICLYDFDSLFAGKIHAIICRNWKNRVKGRDLYDYVFFLANGGRVNMTLLRNKLICSGVINSNDCFDESVLKSILVEKFNQIDFKDAKEDVIPFINDINSINLWGIDFFVSITDNLSD